MIRKINKSDSGDGDRSEKKREDEQNKTKKENGKKWRSLKTWVTCALRYNFYNHFENMHIRI